MFNKRVTKVLNDKLEEMTVGQCEEWFDTLPKPVETFEPFMEFKPEPLKYQIIFTLKDGSTIVANDSASVLLDGMITTVNMVLSDIVERQVPFTFIGNLGLSAELVKSIAYYKVIELIEQQ